MGRYNLLEEPWIAVLSDKTGEKKEVSMLEFFRDAGSFQSLAGEMETQNFAVFRFLLAVVQTVFSRFDLEGKALPGEELDEQWRQIESVDEDDLDDYNDAVEACWKELYRSGTFPKILTDYLEKWRDHFFLFDEKYPFYQVNQAEMNEIMSKIPNKRQPTTVYGKNLNRTISESENKTALFSPVSNSRSGKRGRKDTLTQAELTRWLLTFQGYSGLADKVSLVKANRRASKGWLFDLGGIYLKGRNLFETLVINYIPGCPSDNQKLSGRIQKPCWEFSGKDVVERLCAESFIDNLAELYTNWGRAIFIALETDPSEPVEIQIVKLPEIEHSEYSIEPMTLWKKSKDESNKSHFTLKKHEAEQALWRSFGLMAMKTSSEEENYQRQPGIFAQYERLKKAAGSQWTDVIGISMEDDGNSTSWLPVDEITDSFRINDFIVTDNDTDGWVVRINNVVETTKDVISRIYENYLRGICEIRNLRLKPIDPLAQGFITRESETMYAMIDRAFKEWLLSLTPGDSKEDKTKEWCLQLRKIVLKRGRELFENSTSRDLKGRMTGSGVENIATKYLQFLHCVNKKLGGGKA